MHLQKISIFLEQPHDERIRYKGIGPHRYVPPTCLISSRAHIITRRQMNYACEVLPNIGSGRTYVCRLLRINHVG